jgi:hypothetical protein
LGKLDHYMKNSAWARLTAALVAALLTAQVAFLMFAQVTLAKSKQSAAEGELIPGKRALNFPSWHGRV